MKLHKSLLERILKSDLKNKELNVLLYLLQVQDDLGTVLNVHWKEICENVGMVAQSFYNSINSLESKGFITVSKECPLSGEHNGWGLHTIQILIPDAPPRPQVEKISQEELVNYFNACGPYLNLKEYSLINTDIFRKQSAGVKKIILYFLWRHQSNLAISKKGMKPHDIILTPMVTAEMLGFEWGSSRTLAGILLHH